MKNFILFILIFISISNINAQSKIEIEKQRDFYISKNIETLISNELFEKSQKEDLIHSENTSTDLKKEQLHTLSKAYWESKFWITHPKLSKIYKSIKKEEIEKSVLFPLYCFNGGFEEPLDSGGYQFFRNEANFTIGSDHCAILDTPISWIELSDGDVNNFRRMNSTEQDIFFPNQLPVVYRGNNSVRLNSPNSHISGSCTSGDHGMDKMSKNFSLSLQNGNWPDEIYLTYALVLEAPNGHVDKFPFFSARVVNSQGLAVSDQICIDAESSSLIFEDTDHDCQNAPNVGFKPWACEFVTLDHSLLEAGEELTLEIVMADCGLGGHTAYAYIDDLCTQSSLTNEYTYEYSECSNGNYSISLDAEDNGFNASYVWRLFETSVRGSVLDGDIIDANPATQALDPISTLVGQNVVFDLDVNKNYFILYDLNANDCNNSQTEQRMALEPSFTAILEDLHFEDDNGNEKNEFCLGDEVYIDATTSNNITNHFIVVTRKPIGSNQPLEYLANLLVVNGPSFNFSAWLSTLGHSLEEGYQYSVKLAVQNNCDPWTEMISSFEVYSSDIHAQFHFENEHQNAQEYFCSYETVFLNGNASAGEARYVIEVSKAEIGNINFTFVTTGEVDGQVNTFNFTQWMIGQTTPLEEGHIYRVELKLKNDCSTWTESVQQFIYDECCAPPTDLSCTIINGTRHLTWAGPSNNQGYYIYIDPTSSCCGNEEPFPTTPQGIYVPNNRYSLKNIRFRCFQWQVKTICDDESYSVLSEPACFNSNQPCWGFTPSLSEIDKNNQQLLAKPSISPNPNSGKMMIELQVSEPTNINIEIYDINGNLIEKLRAKNVTPGLFQKEWIAPATVNTGIYMVQIHTSFGSFQEKIMIIQ